MPDKLNFVADRPSAIGFSRDVVADVLATMHLESTVFCRAEFGLPWALAKGALDGAPFHLVISGRCFVAIGDESWTEVNANEFIVLPRGDPHVIAGAPSSRNAVQFKTVLDGFGARQWVPGTSVAPVELRFGGAGTLTRLVSGVFSFRDRRRNPILNALPQTMVVKGEGIAPWLDPLIALLASETASGEPGASVVASRLADVLFVQAIRGYLRAPAATTPGWLKGLTDPAVGRALAAVHSNWSRRWTIAVLAAVAGVSRSTFCARFTRLVGSAPYTYISECRMHEAAGLLARGEATSRVAKQIGYESDVSFRKAFRRWSGQTPRTHRLRSVIT
jgi:AraC-like DNA-binding protein